MLNNVFSKQNEEALEAYMASNKNVDTEHSLMTFNI